jgi:hypothetical protein
VSLPYHAHTIFRHRSISAMLLAAATVLLYQSGTAAAETQVAVEPTPSPTQQQTPPPAADQGTPAPGAAPGAPTAEQLEALAKEAQNPVGNVTVLPFQNNFNYGVGPTKASVYNLNLQPVIPIKLSPKWNLVERAIVPLINLPPLLPVQDCLDLGIASAASCGGVFGIGDIQLQSYFAPVTKPGSFIWGAGPVFKFPAPNKALGNDQFGAGVNLVGLVMPGRWVIGMLVAQQWRVAGPSAPAAETWNNFLAQPFVNYNFKHGWALSMAPAITANWNAPGNRKWTVPIGLAVVQTNTWFKLPMSFQVGYYGNVVRPPDAPYGLIRFQWALIWPIKKR